MRLLVFFFCTFLFVALVNGQDGPPNTSTEFEQQYQWRIQQEILNEIYIPKDLTDAFVQLNRLVDTPSKEKFKTATEEEAARKLHFSLGRWMIVNWGFYEGSRLTVFLNQIGLRHPDDMARFLIITYHRNLNRKPLDVQQLVETLINVRKAAAEKNKKPGTVLQEETRTRPKQG
jgi:hypothetical protein